MKKISFLIIFFIFFPGAIQKMIAQQTPDSCRMTISLLTCSPGKELYSTFGHSAFRVVDSSQGTDLIFNYGTFDFNDPHFYSKFIRGKLLYFVSIENFEDFIGQYQYEQRSVIEQILNLSSPEKQTLLAALYENAKEENKYYKYDFVYDNCTTRLRDMIARYAKDSLIYKNILPYKGVSFRNLIHEYLNKGNQYWSKLGIDILLGSPLDKKISNTESMFLPDYLLKGFDSAVVGQTKLVSGKMTILQPFIQREKKPFFTPLLFFTILLLLIAIFSFAFPLKTKNFFLFFDTGFFLLCGALGFLLLFMWFGTDHLTCKNNFNLLWALPTHLPVSILLFKKSDWLKKYFRFIFWLSLVLMISWFLLPQQMNIALLPVTGIIAIRSFFLAKNL